MTRPFQILLIFVLAAVFSTVSPPPAPADDMVLFKNGRTLRADELELKDGAYRITTMSGGIMEVPVQLVERVISCVVDKEVEEQRGTVPAGSRAPGSTRSEHSSAMKIPPMGLGGGAARSGNRALGGSKAGAKGSKATVIPPRGGRSMGKGGSKLTNPGKGKEASK